MTHSNERWHQLEELFEAARDLSPAQRERLFGSHSLDSKLRQEIDDLLEAHDALESSDEEGLPDFLAPVRASALSQRADDAYDPLGINGKSISHFQIEKYLASGGMGVIYTAMDTQLGRTVALKFPLPHQRLNQIVKERFIREARSTAVLDHPNLCTVYEVGESTHGLFMAMPLYKGETISDRLEREGTLSVAEAIRITRELATGLGSAHAAGIVHRDMKPGNVMLLPNGAVKILDFGIAKALDVTFTRSRNTLGTIAYMAPEQIKGDAVDGRTDLWAVGVILYTMLTGELPFRGETEVGVLHSILHDEPRRIATVDARARRVLDTLVHGLLQKKSRDRYASAEMLLADLDAVDAGRDPAHTVSVLERARHRIRMPMASLGVILLSALGAVTWLSSGSRPAAPNPATPAVRFVNNAAVISTSSELLAVLSPANEGKHVRLKPGTFTIDRPLVVPDGMTLEGEGVMTYALEGYATGFREGPKTTLRMVANTAGDLLTLGNNVTLRNLEIADLDGRTGNLLKIESRRAGDVVAATITESVLINPNPLTPGNASGRGFQITTRNASKGAGSRAHEGAVVSVKLLRSVLKSPAGGGGFFAFNFAPKSRISLEIQRSLIGGSSEANGGVSNPDSVYDSEVRITSTDNVYRNEWSNLCTQLVTGWNLTGGSGTPVARTLPGTAHNRLIVRSTNDLIEDFTTGIVATGSRRFYPAPRNGPSNDNHVDLLLTGTTISTPECPSGVPSGSAAGMSTDRVGAVMDFRFIGGSVARGEFGAGDNNTVRVELRGVTGSGKRANRYADAASFSTPLKSELRGKGNRLEIVGDRKTFKRLNDAIDPAPGPEFFTTKR
ncbi:MAG TPA: serine/threonine-protein kinase [Gemmatimonadaceae bacterium]